MTSTKRATSLVVPFVLLAAGLTGCGVRLTDKQSGGCPDDHRTVALHASINDQLGDELDGREYTMTVAAESPDPEYQGIYIVGTGVSGRNPVTRREQTSTDPQDVDPVLCIPAERAVSVMVRMSMQNPQTAYETINCTLTDEGVAGFGALGKVAYDRVEIALTDLIGGADTWHYAQCNWVYVPPGYGGDIPPAFPRAD
jgi:hypothetical protein